MSLTVYLVERGGDGDRAKESLKGLPNVIIEPKKKGTTCTGFNKCETDWYLILFDDEWLDIRLNKALPVFMESDYDYFNLHRMMVDSQRFFINPRLFRKDVILNKSGEPVGTEYTGTNILDGFICMEG
jgi:hypothetical protein